MFMLKINKNPVSFIPRSYFFKFLIFLTAIAHNFLCGCGRNSDQPYILNNSLLNPSIIGGKEISYELPIASMMAAIYNLKTHRICSAVIKGKSHLLTSAHCLIGTPQYHIALFGGDLNCNNLVTRQIKNFFLHPGWTATMDDTQNFNDIAIVEIRENIPQGFRAMPLFSPELLQSQTLQFTSSKKQNLHQGMSPFDQLPINTTKKNIIDLAYIAGYGISDAQDKSSIGKLRVAPINMAHLSIKSKELIYNPTVASFRGPCHGDSGGPLFIFSPFDHEPLLLGLNSRKAELIKTKGDFSGNIFIQDDSDEELECLQPPAYTLISSYTDWITDTLEKLDLAHES